MGCRSTAARLDRGQARTLVSSRRETSAGSGWLPPQTDLPSRWPPLWSLPCTDRLELLAVPLPSGLGPGLVSSPGSPLWAEDSTAPHPLPRLCPAVWVCFPALLPSDSHSSPDPTAQRPASGNPGGCSGHHGCFMSASGVSRRDGSAGYPLGLCLLESGWAAGPGRPVWGHGDAWEQHSSMSPPP